MEKNKSTVKLIDLIVYFSVALVIANVIFFTAIKSADRQEHEATVVKVQVQSEHEAQSLYTAAKGDRQ
ncbi:hypothetical protein [Acinetobacter sp. ANC 4640]